MTEAKWLACRTSRTMLVFLRGKLTVRQSLLIGCGCCRIFWSEITHREFRNTLPILERMVDGIASKKDIAEGRRAANLFMEMCAGAEYGVPRRFKTQVARCGAWIVNELYSSDKWEAWSVAESLENWLVQNNSRSEAVLLPRIVREIFGNPFRPVFFDPMWRTSDVMLLAKGIYDERAYDRMPILADALQDADCDSDDILTHLRDATAMHVRGCWALDLVLGKE